MTPLPTVYIVESVLQNAYIWGLNQLGLTTTVGYSLESQGLISTLDIQRFSKHRKVQWYIVQYNLKQESSAKLTNQRVSYAFTSSPLSFHPAIFCLLPSSSIVILVFYLFSTVYA